MKPLSIAAINESSSYEVFKVGKGCYQFLLIMVFIVPLNSF